MLPEVLTTINTGVGIIVKLLKFWNRKTDTLAANNSSSTEKINTVSLTPQTRYETPEPQIPRTYAQKLGQRHKNIRENILGLDPRTMATFYKLPEVQELEAFESGENEFPINLTEQFCESFQVQKSFLYEGKGTALSSISSSMFDKYIKNGFVPHLYCEAPENPTLYMKVYICMAKSIKIGHRSILLYAKSDTEGSFDSTGGGKINICELISAMKRNGLTEWNRAHILTTATSTISEIRSGIFYPKDEWMPGHCSAKYEDRFISWFTDCNNY